MGKKILYLGLDPSRQSFDGAVIHYPVIRIAPKKLGEITEKFSCFMKATHLLFTSRSAVRIFCEFLQELDHNLSDLSGKVCLAVGKATGSLIRELGLPEPMVASTETAEGLVNLIDELGIAEQEGIFCFWPHSAQSRSVVVDAMSARKIKLCDCVVYEPVLQRPDPVPDLGEVGEIVFTSPSTIKGFLQIYGEIPRNKKLTAIGPITRSQLEN